MVKCVSVTTIFVFLAGGVSLSCSTGTDVMIFKIFSPKNFAKIMAFLAQTTASFCKNCDHNIGF
jgi:hypothetical protein